MRRVQATKLYDDKEQKDQPGEAGTEKISAMGSLMKNGTSFEKSLKLVDQYKFVDMKLFLNKKKLKQLSDKFPELSQKDLIVNLINTQIPGLAVINIDKH